MDIDGVKVEKEDLVTNLNKELGTAEEEKERLESEHSKCLDELKVAQSSVGELEKELESRKSVLNGNIVELHRENDSAMSEIKQFKNLYSNTKQQKSTNKIIQSTSTPIARYVLKK
jgi:chromosome segregation ATPase